MFSIAIEANGLHCRTVQGIRSISGSAELCDSNAGKSLKMSDFLENRANYQVAKKPYQKRGIYYNRDGEGIRYCSSSDGFNWFKWVDKPNPDGEFMVSWFYEKKPEDAGCKFHPIHGWIVTA